jgi:hypothetical protein
VKGGGGISETGLSSELSKSSKFNFEDFEGSLGKGFLPKSVFSISRYLFR